MNTTEPNTPTERFLVVDDDPTFCQVLSRTLSRRGFEVRTCQSAEAVPAVLTEWLPDYATVDLKMEGASGLTVLPILKEANPAMRIVILTGYASINTAVEAVKLGATQYLPKPANADEIIAALAQSESGDESIDVAENPMSVNRLEWEHINKVLADHDGNVSATARALGMHRRTLQRKLAKRPVRH
jgi:two-component system response regulator RegA